MAKGRKVTKYPRNLNNINIGVVIFGFILIYVIISVITYFRKDHIVGYEVKEGALSTNNIYDAVALRQETIVESDTAGYVNYFAAEGARVAYGNLVYTVDESGQLLEFLKSQGTDDVNLSDEDLSELRSQIVDYMSSFDKEEFYTVYDFKIGLDGTVQKLSNNSILNNINSLNSNSAALAAINYKYATGTGIVVYSTDGFEDRTPSDLTVDMFDLNNYSKNQLINNTLVKAGDPVYKLCTSEDWSIVIHESDPDKVQELLDLGYIKVRFLKNQNESWGKVSSVTNANGDTFLVLSFSNSMITFCRDRLLSVELITEDETGLKIPNSSIVNKSFFLIPKEYIIKNNDNTTGVLRDKYDEQGNETTEFVSLSLYNENDTEYYADMSTLRSGDVLIKPDSNDRFAVGKQDTLVGVYNINKGYADFRQIRILYQNDEYSIVRSNTMYGLSVYDYIVLDAAAVNEDGASAAGNTSGGADNSVPTSDNSSDLGAEEGSLGDSSAEGSSQESTSDSSSENDSAQGSSEETSNESSSSE